MNIENELKCEQDLLNKKQSLEKKVKIIFFSFMAFTTVVFLMILSVMYVYQSVYFYRTTSEFQTSNFIIFHQNFDEKNKEWLIGVMAEDRSIVGSFKCLSEPRNNNPQLYYKIHDLTSFSGNTKTEYSFDNLMNCAKVVILPKLNRSVQLRL